MTQIMKVSVYNNLSIVMSVFVSLCVCVHLKIGKVGTGMNFIRIWKLSIMVYVKMI